MAATQLSWHVVAAKKGALVRESPALQSALVETLEPGTRVQVARPHVVLDGGTERARVVYPCHGYVSRKCLGDVEVTGAPARISGKRPATVRVGVELHSEEVGDLELGTEVLVDGATPPGHWKARSYTRLLAPPAGWVPTAALGTSFKVLDHGDVRMGSFRDFSMHCRAGLADVWAKNTATGALPGAIKAFAAAAEGMDGSLRRDRAQLVDKRRQEMGDEPKRPSVMGGPCRAARAAPRSAAETRLLRDADAVAGRVSVVCPTYDGRHRLHALLYDCFDRQVGVPDKELVVFDTGRERSPFFEACDDDRVTYVYQRADLTTGEKRNRLLELATGEICANFDDDNFYCARYLEIMVAQLRAADAELVSLSQAFAIWIRSGNVDRIGGGIEGRGESFVYFKPHRVQEFGGARVGEEGAFVHGQSHHVVQDTYGYYAHTNHGKNVSSAVGGGGRLALADIPNQELATMIREHRFRFLEEGAPAIGEEDASSESDDSDSESNSDD